MTEREALLEAALVANVAIRVQAGQRAAMSRRSPTEKRILNELIALGALAFRPSVHYS